ncbi:MAG: prepilin peptidase [Candidatus Solibacter usitatus]|nr:prepilin peptidase [Candidatus Solibacter usitatus]
MTDSLLFSLLAGAFGLLIGSFLNVCISRLPFDLSIDAPRSHCPRCGAFIAWYDNLPLASFAILGGRCRACRAPISFRYPAVELLTGALFFLVQWHVGGGWAAIKWSLFAAILVELIFSDAETRILPDEFTLWGLALGLMLSPVVLLPNGLFGLVVYGVRPEASEALRSFLGACFAAGALSGGLWLMGALYHRVRGKEGLGFGDVKMVAMLGAFLGLETAILGLMLGSLLGSVLGILWIKLRREDAASYELPFGSFLGAGALIAAATVL